MGSVLGTFDQQGQTFLAQIDVNFYFIIQVRRFIFIKIFVRECTINIVKSVG